MPPTSLPFIVALARAGSLQRAWRLFEDEGYLAHADDPLALSVKGRLLKDRALRATGQDRLDLLTQASAAYLRADACEPAPYRLINAASLQRLAGDADLARTLALQVLERLDGAEQIAETPYYIEATRAEARLLLDDVEAAAAALKRALDASPGNWADQAGTLKQLALICAAAGRDPAWLEPFRPPRSLHYVGHMGFIPDGDAERDLMRRVDGMIEAERIGFAFGALAAGADIIIAERVVAAGGDLHVLLPTPVPDFIRDSVDPAGPSWHHRFEALVAQAQTVQCLTHYSGGHDGQATFLAGEVAMGRAVLNAAQLQGHAVQLAVLDAEGGGVHTARLAARWRQTGRPQVVETCVREGRIDPFADKPVPPGRRDCVAALHVRLDRRATPGDAGFYRLETLGRLIAGQIAGEAAPDMAVSAQGWQLRYAEPQSAARLGLALRSALMEDPELSACVGMAAHYGVKAVVVDPVTQQRLCFDLGGVDDDAVTQWALSGGFAASDAFVAALSIETAFAFHAEPIGEHPLADGPAIQLFALQATVN